ncbi:MAG: hypothetical protein Q8S53_14200, partial [Brevundimonas sp.]|uniref:hypothetical protein n=1 Tax=Brevundimonas sp. TaxID=1871086 RepID=UPI00273267A6
MPYDPALACGGTVGRIRATPDALSVQGSVSPKSLIHMTSALVFLEGSASPQPLVNDLEACGVQ